MSGSQKTYDYDLAGNMTNMNGVTRTYNEANQMTNDGTNTLTYDANGNLLNNGAVWDRANRLVNYGTTTYAYDGLGNRISQDSLTYTLDVQAGLTQVIGDSNGNRFVHSPRGIHAQYDGSTWQYMMQDGLGSVRGVVDSSASVAESHDYDPYGNYIGTAPTESYFGFTGEQTDVNVQVYLRARYYDPSLSIFPSLDPFEGTHNRPMSLNGYSWVEGNVINAVDPSGMQSDCPHAISPAPASATELRACLFLNPARRLNQPLFTNMTDEALAAMSYRQSQSQLAWNGGLDKFIDNSWGLFSMLDSSWYMTHRLIDINLIGNTSFLSGPSFGPPNIYFTQAKDAALWWEQYVQEQARYNSNVACLGDLDTLFYARRGNLLWGGFSILFGHSAENFRLMDELLTDAGSIEFYTLSIIRMGWRSYENEGHGYNDPTQFGINDGTSTQDISVFALQMGIYAGVYDVGSFHNALQGGNSINNFPFTGAIATAESISMFATRLGVTAEPFVDYLPYNKEEAELLYNEHQRLGQPIPLSLAQAYEYHGLGSGHTP